MSQIIKKLKFEKRGISLVEILVALAIAGIILALLGSVMTQGVTIFRKQSTVVDLANESQLITGQLEQCLMEASAFTVYRDNSTGEIFIYTGEADHKNNCWTRPTGVERTIIVSGEKLYISGEYCTDTTFVNEGNLISSYIDTFDIKISEKSIEKETDEAGAVIAVTYTNPIVVEVNYVIERDGNKKAADMTIKLRNYIEQCIDESKPLE